MKAHITKRFDRETLQWEYTLDLHTMYLVTLEAEASDPFVDDNAARSMIHHLLIAAKAIFEADDYELTVVNDPSVDISSYTVGRHDTRKSGVGRHAYYWPFTKKP